MPPAYPHLSQASSTPDPSARIRQRLARALARGFADPRPGMETVERVLLMRPDHLGDLLFLGPALRSLRQRMPQVHVTLAIGPWGRAARPGLEGGYDALVEIPFPAFERERRAGLLRRWGLLPPWAWRLRRQRFDAALIFRPDHWWGAMLASFARIPNRLGYDTIETAPWLTRALPLPREHAVLSNLRLIDVLTGQKDHVTPLRHPLRFTVKSEDKQAAAGLLATHGIDITSRYVIIHPGAGAAIKLWQVEKWQQVAGTFLEEGVNVLLTGDQRDRALTHRIANSVSGSVDLAGRTSFAILAAILAEANVVVGPDSGPLNLAVSVGTRTVHLFGPADAVMFGPWGDPGRHRIIYSDWTCAPCRRFDWPDLEDHGCVRDISAEVVIAATRRLLSDSSS